MEPGVKHEGDGERQVAAAVFGTARWASLDDLLLHAALGLEGGRVLRTLHEEEWEADLQVSGLRF